MCPKSERDEEKRLLMGGGSSLIGASGRVCSEVIPDALVTLFDALSFLVALLGAGRTLYYQYRGDGTDQFFFGNYTYLYADYVNNPIYSYRANRTFSVKSSDIAEVSTFYIVQVCLFAFSIPFSLWSDCTQSRLLIKKREEIQKLARQMFDAPGMTLHQKFSSYAHYLKSQASAENINLSELADITEAVVMGDDEASQRPIIGGSPSTEQNAEETKLTDVVLQSALDFDGESSLRNAIRELLAKIEATGVRETIATIEEKLKNSTKGSHEERRFRVLLVATQIESSRDQQILVALRLQGIAAKCGAVVFPFVSQLIRIVAIILLASLFQGAFCTGTPDFRGQKEIEMDCGVALGYSSAFIAGAAIILSVLTVVQKSMVKTQIAELQDVKRSYRQSNIFSQKCVRKGENEVRAEY